MGRKLFQYLLFVLVDYYMVKFFVDGIQVFVVVYYFVFIFDLMLVEQQVEWLQQKLIQKLYDGVQIFQFVFKGCISQCYLVRCFQVFNCLGDFGVLVFNVLCFVQDNEIWSCCIQVGIILGDYIIGQDFVNLFMIIILFLMFVGRAFYYMCLNICEVFNF